MIKLNYKPWEETETDVLEADTLIDQYSLVVYNDDVNTFDHVIDTLVKVCGHTMEQAEQCTIIIHFKGKCSVKVGSFEELKPLRQGICDKGINAEILEK